MIGSGVAGFPPALVRSIQADSARVPETRGRCWANRGGPTIVVSAFCRLGVMWTPIVPHYVATSRTTKAGDTHGRGDRDANKGRRRIDGHRLAPGHQTFGQFTTTFTSIKFIMIREMPSSSKGQQNANSWIGSLRDSMARDRAFEGVIDLWRSPAVATQWASFG